MNRTGSGSFNSFSDTTDVIQVISCVQGNTVRSIRNDLQEYAEDHYAGSLSRICSNRCEVYDFSNRRSHSGSREMTSPEKHRRSSAASQNVRSGRSSRRSRGQGSAAGKAMAGSASGASSRKAYRNGSTAGSVSVKSRSGKRSGKRTAKRTVKRTVKTGSLQYAFMGVLLAVMITVFAGIGSRADMREIPKAYKYYDTITVGNYENLLDIVERYDNRDYYETQTDYLKELCRINNLEYSTSEYPDVSPGTHLIVPYYSEELK